MPGVRAKGQANNWRLTLPDVLPLDGPIVAPRSDHRPTTEFHEPTDRRVPPHLLSQIPLPPHRDVMFHQQKDLLSRPRRN